MGMYDTLDWQCPKCGAHNQDQTKDGPCAMLSTTIGPKVPWDRVELWRNTVVECYNCDQQYVVKTDAPTPPPATLSLEPYADDQGEDDE